MAYHPYGLGNESRILWGSDGAGTAISTNAPVTSQIFSMVGRDHVSFHLTTPIGSTLAGTAIIQASNNYAAPLQISFGSVPYAGDWATLAAMANFQNSAGLTVTSGQFNQLVYVGPIRVRMFRVVFTQSSGSGILSVFVDASST